MSVDNKPIIISAPAGGLGRHLAALVDYAVNAQTESVDLVSPTVVAEQGKTTVIYSANTPTAIANEYPEGRILQVTTTADDAIQMAYNHLVIEQWRAVRDIADIHYIQEIQDFLGEQDVSLVDIFSDSQFMDNAFVQLLIERVARSKTIQTVGADPRATVTIEFDKLCCPANTAGNADIQPLLDFLGDANRSAEVPQLWHTFVRSLHHAKRNILNTANWS